MIRLLQKYCGDGYEDKIILKLIGLMFLSYRVQKDIMMPTTERWDAVLQVVQQLVPDFGPDDPFRTVVLSGAIQFYYDKNVLRWLLGNINGMLDEKDPKTSCIHEAISKMLLHRDPISTRMIVCKTTNLHRCFNTRMGIQTPTSLAMFQSSVFFAWKNLLQDLSYNVERFVQQELEEQFLVKNGWTAQTLTALFEYTFVPYEGKKNFGFPECERCGDQGMDVSAIMKVDLEWRRQLRQLRLGQVPRPQKEEMTSITIEVCGADSTISKRRNEHLQSPSVESEIHRRVEEVGLKTVPFRLVCSDACRDGICVAWIYENDSLDEPELPACIVQERVLHELDATQDQVVEVDDCPSRKMPGAFCD